MKARIVFFVAFFISNFLFSQYGKGDYNRIGISAGVIHTNLMTDNFDVKPAMSWTAGLAVRGNYYNNFAMEFGMNFSDSRFEINTANPVSVTYSTVSFKAVQINLLLCYKIADSHISLDLGPVLQVNGKLEFQNNDENRIITGYNNLTLKDIEDITTINGLVKAGISGGFENVKLGVHYLYGLNNFLNNLNNQEELAPFGKFKGNLGYITGRIIVYL